MVLKQPFEERPRLGQVVAFLPFEGRPSEIIEHAGIPRVHMPNQVFEVRWEGVETVDHGIGDRMIMGLAVRHARVPGCLTRCI